MRTKGGTGQESYRQLGRTTNIITGVELGLPKTPRGFETEGYIVVKCLSCVDVAQWLERLSKGCVLVRVQPSAKFIHVCDGAWGSK